MRQSIDGQNFEMCWCAPIYWMYDTAFLLELCLFPPMCPTGSLQNGPISFLNVLSLCHL